MRPDLTPIMAKASSLRFGHLARGRWQNRRDVVDVGAFDRRLRENVGEGLELFLGWIAV